MLTRKQIDEAWISKKSFACEILGDLTLHRSLQPDLKGDRRRCDLMLHDGKVGHRGPSKDSDWDFDFFTFEAHELLYPEMNSFVEDFSSDRCPIGSAQIRFRVGDENKRGLWIDSSRESLSKLVTQAEGTAWLGRCIERNWSLELGQKFLLEKESAFLQSNLKPSPYVWLPSFNCNNHEIPLQSYIKNFSQPGEEANRALIAHGMDLIDTLRFSPGTVTWAELGAGYGNLTAAYASLWDDPKWIVESDPASAQALALNAKNYFPSTQIHRGTVEQETSPESVDVLVADPPRSGFGSFFKSFDNFEYLLHMSCDLKGLMNDTPSIREKMKLCAWSALDLFPGTPYIEVLSLWQRK